MKQNTNIVVLLTVLGLATIGVAAIPRGRWVGRPSDHETITALRLENAALRKRNAVLNQLASPFRFGVIATQRCAEATESSDECLSFDWNKDGAIDACDVRMAAELAQRNINSWERFAVDRDVDQLLKDAEAFEKESRK